MGGTTFSVKVRGQTAEQAFSRAVEEAAYESGHGGYTGTIAEKHNFVLIPEPPEALKRELLAKILKETEALTPGVPPTVANDRGASYRAALASKDPISVEMIAYAYVNQLFDADDPRISDKWGPAGCLVLRKPSLPLKLTKAKAETMAKGTYGESARIEVKTERASKKNGGKRRITASIYITRTNPGMGSNVKKPDGGWENCVCSRTDENLEEALGALFAEQGVFLFFGWASC